MNQVVHVERSVAAPPEAVFALLADPTGWPAWSGHDRGEVVRDAPVGEPRGVGAVRAFTVGRLRSVEEVVAFEPPSRFGYELRSGLPVRGYRADVRLAPAPDGGTVVTWHSEFRARVPGTGPLIRRGLQRFIERATRGLARCAAPS
jgi:uncharacterized protein YndB with AHSA1/START domain